MLVLDQEQISAKDFCRKFDIDLEKIMNNPVFELTKKHQKLDKANGNVMKVPSRVSWPARTFFRDREGNTHELVYAATRNYRMIGKERIPQYKPRYIVVDTAKFSTTGDIDRTVFCYINTANTSSPFGDGKNTTYSHLDPTAIAKERMKTMNDVSTAMSTIQDMDDVEMLILAKGIGATFKDFNPFVDGANTHVDIVRVEMMGFAQRNATNLLELIDNTIARTKGQIINLVDKGILKEYTNMNMRQWKWEKGDRKGNVIGDQIVDPHADSREYLLNYILGNLGQYYSDIHSVNNSISVEESAMDFLKNQKESVVVLEKSSEGLPQNYQEVMAWLGDNGFRKMPPLAKKVNEAIQSGEIHNANIRSMVTQIDAAMEAEKD